MSLVTFLSFPQCTFVTVGGPGFCLDGDDLGCVERSMAHVICRTPHYLGFHDAFLTLKLGSYVMGDKSNRCKMPFFFFLKIVSGVHTVRMISDMDVGAGHLDNTELLRFSTGTCPTPHSR